MLITSDRRDCMLTRNCSDQRKRSLQWTSSLDRASMTVEGCLDYCADLGFNLAGVEYGQECCEHYPASLVLDR